MPSPDAIGLDGGARGLVPPPALGRPSVRSTFFGYAPADARALAVVRAGAVALAFSALATAGGRCATGRCKGVVRGLLLE